MPTKAEVVEAGITLDATYMGRVYSELNSLPDAKILSIGSLCVAPFMSLVIYEASKKTSFLSASKEIGLSEDVNEVCGRARHSLKLFTDTNGGIDRQLTHFEQDIMKEQSKYFLGNTWLPLARFLETDLGVFTYEGQIITTTHSATFHLGIPSDRLFRDGFAAVMQPILQQMGRCLGALGAGGYTGEPSTFASYVSDSSLRNRDVRAAKHYGRSFNGPETPYINGTLTDFQAITNFIASLLIAGADPLSLEYSLFKIRYIALFHVLASLHVLQGRLDMGLSRRSSEVIEKIVGTSEAQIVTDPSTRGFRNTLMHYAPTDAMLDELDLRAPLFGLVAVSFPNHDFRSLSALVDQCIRDTARELNQWAMMT
ncbi:hypothetical protein [Streptomyces sp. NBC_00063]|uniref:hypothetical protein n=1 Tax=Streptomyces sp. NBC_00063 TaxID=2975638 RepID=UPI002255745E|nr:hypothetical protein [Streptomyces sp. NBC_00063]MCX5441185.1 hypothetical protein [Streptomyces sp. NBC_00063]